MKKIGILGIGLMGEAIAQRLIELEVPIIVYNRTPEKLTSLKNLGAEIAITSAEVLTKAECIILMLSDGRAIEEVLLSDIEVDRFHNRTIIQMGTIAPSESQAIRERIINLGGEYLEAPVLGSIPEARQGKLLSLVGATREQFNKWSELFGYFSPEPLLIGEVGKAAALKLALNQLIAGLTASFSLSLGLIEREGIDVEIFMEILRQSALYASTFDKKLTRMRDRDYSNPNFPTKHLLKDTDLFLERARADRLNISSLLGVREVIQKAIELGLGDLDYSAIFSAIKSIE
jgi:3-hydroxyisobutyrate dehydrogenase